MVQFEDDQNMIFGLFLVIDEFGIVGVSVEASLSIGDVGKNTRSNSSSPWGQGIVELGFKLQFCSTKMTRQSRRLWCIEFDRTEGDGFVVDR